VTGLFPAAAANTFNWTTVFVAVLNLLVGGALVSFIRSRPSLRKIDADREANLLSERAKEMAEMRKRIEKLEQEQEEKDAQHEAARKRAEKLVEAERAFYRHQYGNLSQAFSSLLLLLKKGVPVEEAVDEVEKMRVEQLARETVEKAALRALEVKNAAADDDQ
jgi:mannitol-specific phosphotransferase system IIBC component